MENTVTRFNRFTWLRLCFEKRAAGEASEY